MWKAESVANQEVTREVIHTAFLESKALMFLSVISSQMDDVIIKG